MAATAWAYFIPYADDPSVALRAFQERMFSSRAYRLPTDDVREMDSSTLNQYAPDLSKLKKMLKIAKVLDRAFADLGADTTAAESDTADIESLIQRAEKDGFASAAKPLMVSRSQAVPKSIEDLRILAAETGTHSILDIDRIAIEPAFGAATPLSDKQLRKRFRTLRPSFEHVQAADLKGAMSEFRERWQAIYCAVYSNEHPTHYFFTGVTGD